MIIIYIIVYIIIHVISYIYSIFIQYTRSSQDYRVATSLDQGMAWPFPVSKFQTSS